MRKRVVPRIFLFLLLNCTAFILLSAMQFTRRGNFSSRIGGMVINGRYSLSEETIGEDGRRSLDGGASVFFGGLEFRLLALPDSETGFFLVDMEGGRRQVFPETITALENEAIFALPGGAKLSFISQSGGSGGSPGGGPGGSPGGGAELRISAQLPRGVSAIDIPFRPQRSSFIRDSDRGIFSISYNGGRYQFSRSQQGLEDGRLVLLASSPAITYRAIADMAENNPADFIVPQAQTAESFRSVLDLWTTKNFEEWGRNMPSQADEDLVIAWCAEAIRRGGYRTASSIVPAAFSTGPGRSWESAVYQFDRRYGNWERAARAIGEDEREKIGRISQLLAEKNAVIFAENHPIEYLAVRGHGDLIEEFAANAVAFASGMDPFEMSLAMSRGILECHVDMGRWRPFTDNPFEALAETASRLVAGGLRRWEDRVLVFSDGRADIELNLRLGMALHAWGERSGKADWAALGRSLALSVISLGEEGSVPAFLTIGPRGEFAAASEVGAASISTAKLYRLLGGNEHVSRAVATGASGIWAWTAASSVTITQNEQQMDINVSFPAGETHYVAIRNVKPFPLLQIYESNWRRAPDFEGYYDASGWNYFERDQTLVVKMRHRANVERIRILFTAPPPPPPPPSEETEPQESPVETPVERPYERTDRPYERPERPYERMVD